MITKAGVPSNKVVVGVTSYGRAFRITTPGCYGPECTYTGAESGATRGRCTGTAGYISDAEIKELASSGRVTASFLDASSQTNILVYDDVQWVGWMDPSNKAARVSLYQALSMGGMTDWAVDLEDFFPSPVLAGSWPNFIRQIKVGVDPKNVGERTGNWSSIPCTAAGVNPALDYPPDERWSMLDVNHAWIDAVNVYVKVRRGQGHSFIQSLADTFHAQENMDCGTLEAASNCDNTQLCKDDAGTGPGGYLIMVRPVFPIEVLIILPFPKVPSN